MKAAHAVYRIDPMTPLDVPEVSRVERKCFSNPWPATAYRRELRDVKHNSYLVLRELLVEGAESGINHTANGNALHSRGEIGLLARALSPLRPFGRKHGAHSKIIGFAGMWHQFDEAHITTIGVEPELRGRGLGELLLISVFDEAVRRGAGCLTLEVRVSNEPAQALYRKYAFTVEGMRKRYYSDNNEDAYIMWSPSLRDADYVRRLVELRQDVAKRFGLSHPPVGWGAALALLSPPVTNGAVALSEHPTTLADSFSMSTLRGRTLSHETD